MIIGGESMNVASRISWSLGGKAVCFKGFCLLLGVQKKRVSNVVRDIKKGMCAPEKDGRKSNPLAGRPAAATCVINAFLEWAYQNLAETLAEAPIKADPDSDDEPGLPDDVPNGMLVASENLALTSEIVVPDEQKQVHYLAPMSMIDFYDTFVIFCGNKCEVGPEEARGSSEDAGGKKFKLPAYETFRLAVKKCKFLKFQVPSQHAKCSVCARLSKLREHANLESEKAEIRAMLEGLVLSTC
jgi:hypothetical protein